MITINLYQSQKIDLQVDFPSSWNDLSQTEIKFIAKCLLTESDPATVRALVLKHILENRTANSKSKNPKSEIKNALPLEWFLHLDAEQVVLDVFPLLDFIFQKNDLTNTPEPLKLKNLVFYPQIFENITCAEYEDCEVIANQFSEKASRELLTQLAAILFRPAAINLNPLNHSKQSTINSEPEPYLQFNPRTQTFYTYQYKQKLKYFKSVPHEDLYAIFIWYAGCRAELPLMYPTVYEGGSSGDGPDLAAFTKCIHSGAGPKNGTRQQVRGTKLYEFMFDMEQEAIHAKEMEAEIERIKNQH